MAFSNAHDTQRTLLAPAIVVAHDADAEVEQPVVVTLGRVGQDGLAEALGLREHAQRARHREAQILLALPPGRVAKATRGENGKARGGILQKNNG